jgi:SAM-dependent methyltransferase
MIDDKTKQTKAMYEKYPFPSKPILNFDKDAFNNFLPDDLTAKIKKSIVLDAGCGTGMGIYALSHLAKEVYGFDLSQTSIDMAKENMNKLCIKNTILKQGDIFDFPFDKKFDFIFSMGVLHHTKNARMGFDILCNHLNEGGYVVIALYNKYGGIRYRLKRFIGSFIKDEEERMEFARKHLVKRLGRTSNDRLDDIYIADGYLNPVVSFHSIDEVLEWFADNNIEFTCLAKPACLKDLFKLYINLDDENYKRVFRNLSTHTQRIILQFLWGAYRYSGYFTMIGRKKDGGNP